MKRGILRVATGHVYIHGQAPHSAFVYDRKREANAFLWN